MSVFRTALLVLLVGFSVIALSAELTGKVVSTDDFYGNINTDIARTTVEEAGYELGDSFTFVCGEFSVEAQFVVTYSDVDEGEWIGLINAEDTLQVAISFGSADESADCWTGDDVAIVPASG